MLSGRQMLAPRMTAPVAFHPSMNPQGMAIGMMPHPEPTLYQHNQPRNNYRQKSSGGYVPPALRYRPSGKQPHPRSNPTSTEPTNREESASAEAVTTSDVTPATAAEQPTEQPVANTKEKTPMCLINELARFNKVQHQYCLTDEQGPAHKKTFFVKLKLGEEEFAASGASIKKAQHAAAAVALEQTKLQHPPLKQRSSSSSSPSTKAETNASVTPTVELNALAMKRGELAVYRPFERHHVPAQNVASSAGAAGAIGGGASANAGGVTPAFANHAQAQLDYRGGYYNQRYRYPKPAHHFCVALKVGEREFVGEGETMQAARHNAASLALKLLNSLPMPTREPKTEKNATGSTEETASGKAASTGSELLKSEVSLVHEIALKRNYTVEFEIIKESGPPHMRTFVTRCKCGPLVTDGEGSSKKLSKKVSAEKMVGELRQLPPLPPPPPSAKPKKNLSKSKQSKNLIKNVAGLSAIGVNPISRLIQIQQAKKEKEPTFALIAENGAPRSREFVVQVTVGESVCNGAGPNKKLAKRNAAEQMLQLLGYPLTPPPPAKPALKPSSDTSLQSSPPLPAVPQTGGAGDKRVTFVDNNHVTSQEEARKGLMVNGDVKLVDAELGNMGYTVPAPTAAVPGPPVVVPCPVRTIDQLTYLSRVMGFEVQETHIPKLLSQDKTEYISMLTLGTNPPQFYNGSGPSIEAAVDNAAMAALRKLSEVGLEGGGMTAPVVSCSPATTQTPAAASTGTRSPRNRQERPVISTVVSVKKEMH